MVTIKFSIIKPGAVVVNTAPMETVDLGALEKRLKKGDITFILDHIVNFFKGTPINVVN
ncbi:MAG: hypothetical protein HY518_00690 [Candidatus Aenigmarchaeota archaeon]|nr:hypothetical protein [Candidatus Aenigmarchaeota archaeon]